MKKTLLFVTILICSVIKSQANDILKEFNLGEIQLGKVYENIEVETLSPHLFRREYSLTNNLNFSKAKEFFDAKKRLVKVELTISANEDLENFYNSNVNILAKHFGEATFLRDTLNVKVAKFYKDYQSSTFGVYSSEKRKLGGNIEFSIALPYILKSDEDLEKQTKKYVMHGMYQGLDSADENKYSITFEVFEKGYKKYPRMIIWNDLENRQKFSKIYLIIDGQSQEFRTFFRLRDDTDLNAIDVVTHDIQLSDDLIQEMINAKSIEMKLENPETGYYNKVKMGIYNQLGLKVLDDFLKE